MAWLALLGTVLSYILLPFALLLRWLLVVLAPVLHLGAYVFSCMILPLRLLANFETLYIYLGVAALIGLVAGSILHLSSTVLASVLNLNAIPEERGQPTAPARSAPSQGKLGRTHPAHLRDQTRLSDSSLEKEYAEWLKRDIGNRREDLGLLGQTIIEEDDDSDDF